MIEIKQLKAMIVKMDERRKFKNLNTVEGRESYRRMNNELRRETDKARESWWMSECEELEEMDRRGRSDLMYAKVKEITRTTKTGARQSVTIKDASGILLTEEEDVKNRWKEYIEELYCADEKPKLVDLRIEPEGAVDEDSKGPDLLGDEIRLAIKEMKRGRR